MKANNQILRETPDFYFLHFPACIWLTHAAPRIYMKHKELLEDGELFKSNIK